MHGLTHRREIAAGIHHVAGDQHDHEQDDAQVPAHLGVVPRELKFAAQQEEIDGEIDAEQDHEYGRDRLEAFFQSPDVCRIWQTKGLGTGHFRQRTTQQRRWICRTE